MARTPLPTLLDKALASVDEHLTAYGHEMTWADPSGGQQGGRCNYCAGRVLVYLIRGQKPSAIADPVMIDGEDGTDYAECKSQPRRRRGRR
jgi:hypothetical protein